MDYKIIVLDLDGTLTNRDKVITPRTKEALMKAQEAGKIVVLASGRPTAGVEPLAKELDLARFGSYILSYNGGMITNCKTGEVIFSSLLPVISCVSHQAGNTKTAMAKLPCFLLVTCSMVKPGVFPFGYINHTHHFIGYLKSAHDRH